MQQLQLAFQEMILLLLMATHIIITFCQLYIIGSKLAGFFINDQTWVHTRDLNADIKPDANFKLAPLQSYLHLT